MGDNSKRNSGQNRKLSEKQIQFDAEENQGRKDI